MTAKSFTETLPYGPSFDMVFIEGGEFLMGAEDNDPDAFPREQPVHRVQLEGFFMGKFPVTQAVWEAVMGNNPSTFISPRRPVDTVSWNDIVHEFLPRLNELTGKTYRLPTEAEWEYAARGGQAGEGCRYAGSDKLDEVGWYEDNVNEETREVGLQYPNELGLFDMSGNVWEWCADWYDSDYYKACVESGIVVNPLGPGGGVHRVVRGGGYFYDPLDCRPAHRSFDSPDYRFDYFGLRFVLPFQSGG